MIFLQPMSTTLAQETQNHFVYGCLSPYSYAWVISGKKHFQPTSGCANFDHLSIKTLALDILIVGIVLFQYIQYCISKGSYDSKVSSLLYCSSSYLLVHGQRDCASIHLHFYGFFSVVLIVGIFLTSRSAGTFVLDSITSFLPMLVFSTNYWASDIVSSVLNK